jgi:hypothetical protein
MGTINIDWPKLEHNHHDYNKIHKVVTNIPKGWETCCIQISYALTMADGPMNLQTGETGMMDQTGTMGFIIGVPMMRKYLDREYGDAEGFDPYLTSAREGTNGRKGIMAFGNRHCDLWLGENIHRPSMYNNQIWVHKSVVDNGLFFWEVPYSEVLGF